MEYTPGISQVNKYMCSVLNAGYLSPKSIQQCPGLHSVHHYSMKEIEAGENQNGTVYNKSMHISEETTDILVVRGDPHFIRQKGMECDIKWMLETSKKKLYRLLDAKSCLRTDYQSLAEVLGIGDSILKQKEKECSVKNCSYTEAIISCWTSEKRKRMTFGLLYKVLKHPGLVGSRYAAHVIETLIRDSGNQVCLFQEKLKGKSGLFLTPVLTL